MLLLYREGVFAGSFGWNLRPNRSCAPGHGDNERQQSTHHPMVHKTLVCHRSKYTCSLNAITQAGHASLLSGPEAATLKSSLEVEDSISLAEALKDRTLFRYGDGYCQWMAQQDFHYPVPASLHLFARSDPDETMRPRDIPSLHSLIKNAVISSTRHLSDDLIQSFLRSGASAVLCLAAEDDQGDIPLSDRLCFLKMFYDALYAGQINHTAFQHVQSVMPHLKNVYQLFQ